MTAFHPIVPAKAIELLEAAGIPHAQRLIRDHAAAGLVKSYAKLIETTEVTGKQACVRGCAISTVLWRRIVGAGADDGVWSGGTVHLASAESIGDVPAVAITGVGFNATDIQRLIDSHRGDVGKRQAPVKQKAIKPSDEDDGVAPPAAVSVAPRRSADPTAIPSGAILCSIKQAQAALGIGRTKVNELMNSGRLERVEDIAGVRITVASIKALVGS